MVEEEDLPTVVLEELRIERERAIKLLEKIECLATRYGHSSFLLVYLKELFEMAETKEEAFFVGMAATFLADKMAMVAHPLEFISTSIEDVKSLMRRAAERRFEGDC